MFDKIKEDAREVLTGSTPENDLRARLHADHVEVTKLIDELLACKDDEHDLRDDLREKIVTNLAVHSTAEEEVVYTFLGTLDQLRDKVAESRVEHAHIDRVLGRLSRFDRADPGLTDVVKELKGLMERHVREEEGTLLPLAEREMGFEPLASLIAPFNARKWTLRDERDEARRDGMLVDREMPTARTSRRLQDSDSQL